MLSNWVLKLSSIGEFTTFLRALFQWHCEKFSSFVQSESPQEQLALMTPHHFQATPCKLLCSHTLNTGIRWQGLPNATLRLNKPISLSLSSYSSFSPWIIFLTPLWILSSLPKFSYLVGTKPENSAACVVWQALSRGKNAFFCLCWWCPTVDAPQYPFGVLQRRSLSFCWKEVCASTLQMGSFFFSRQRNYWSTSAVSEKRNQEIALWAQVECRVWAWWLEREDIISHSRSLNNLLRKFKSTKRIKKWLFKILTWKTLIILIFYAYFLISLDT